MSWQAPALGVLTVAILAAPVLGDWWQRRRHARLRAQPFPSPWRATLEQHLPLYRRLPDTLRRRLEADVLVFLDEKRFYGQDGLVVSDTMRLVIAAQACLLTLNQRVRHYPGFTSIILYPGAYLAHQTARDGPLESTVTHARAGESWYRGPVILSWDDIAADLAHPGHGHNVVLHEFAHKLDEQDGLVDGAPALGAAQRRSWPAVLGREYERLREAIAQHRPTFLDPYAATAPPEFFAVAVEAFFEAGRALAHHHPELYAELRTLFELDPASWAAH